MQGETAEQIDDSEEKRKLYMTVIQNIKKTLDSTSKLEVDAQKVIANLKSKLDTKLKKERELTESFRKFKNEIIAKAISSNKRTNSCSSSNNTILNESVLIEFEKEEERVRNNSNLSLFIITRDDWSISLFYPQCNCIFILPLEFTIM